MSTRTAKLALIGSAAGFFSALFGVGGGVVMVPLLIRTLGFDVRRATGTSLAAIVVIAAMGTAAYGVQGKVSWVQGALVGVPAIVGVLGGTWLQQRLPARTVTLVFSALLVVIGIRLVV